MFSTQVRFAVFAAAVALSAAVAPLPSQAADLSAARALFWKGRYEEAAEQFAALASTNPPAAIGVARCRAALGQREEAEKALATAAEWFPKSAELQAELALLAYERGDHDAAERHAAAALELDKDCVSARYVTAQLLMSAGKLDEAQKAYAWLVSYYNRAPRIDDPMALVYLGRGIAQHARWTRNSNQFRRLVSDVYPSALRQNKDFWPARLETALLYLEKFNEPDAAAEIAAGLATNSQAADLHAARAALALHSFDLATAKSSIDRALAINPQHLWAHQLRADWLFADVRPADASDVLEAARKLNPRNEATLGRLAAAYAAVDGRPDGKHSPRVQALIDEAAGRSPHCGEFFLAAAEAFERMRRFPQAAEFYRLANERMPQLIGTRGQLGLVLMRLGDEASAVKLLEESFAIDPFNVRVKNQLEVLDVLAGYAVLETEHFVIKFDRGHDDLLARYAARYLEEEAWPDLTRKLGYEPPDKTLIEIFSRHGNTSGHNWFSARMVGLPFIGTVGACAGKMVALSSPTELSQKYNWATVLRHELVHVINLQQTDFNVPHWFTEGLAVHFEDQPRPRAWTELLARRTRAGTLFTLDDVTLGFVRPKSGDDWTLAYCQSELYIEHLVENYGADAPGKMLAAYGEHRTTAQALERLFGVSQADFEADYRKLIERVVAAAGPATSQPARSLLELQTRVAEAPDDADATAELARAWLDRDDKPQARRLALAAQKLKPQHPLAAYVLARLQLTIGDSEGAILLLEKAIDRESPQEDLLALLAALKLKANDTTAAQSLYELGDAKLPHSDRWLKGLVKIHLQSGDAKLAPLLKRLVELEPDNVVARKKLAELAISAKDYQGAAEYARHGIYADVQDGASHAALASALAGQGKHQAAAEEFETALRIDDSRADWQAGLARSLIALGKHDEARAAIDRLKDLDAQHSDLESLQKAAQE